MIDRPWWRLVSDAEFNTKLDILFEWWGERVYCMYLRESMGIAKDLYVTLVCFLNRVINIVLVFWIVYIEVLLAMMWQWITSTKWTLSYHLAKSAW